MKYLRSFYKRHRGMAALALLLLLGQVVGTLLIPALIANVVDLGILPGNMDAILRTGGQMLAVALLSAAVAAVARPPATQLLDSNASFRSKPSSNRREPDQTVSDSLTSATSSLPIIDHAPS